MTFKGFNDSKRLLDRSQYFNMLKGKKITAILPRSWKKIIRKWSYNSKKRDVAIRVKMEYYV